ncbi:MAG: hypothetical protein ACK5OX_03955 [Desertimonas sp.]
MERRVRLLVVIGALVAVTAAACDGGESSTGSTAAGDTLSPATRPATTPPSDTASPPTESPAAASTSSTMASSITATIPATSIPATSSTSQDQADEALRQQIAADYIENFAEVDAIVANPSLDGLDARLAEAFEPGSAAFVAVHDHVADLVATGDVVARNNPDLFSVTVESVELVGDRPFVDAVVVACEVDNRQRITPPENSPTGQPVLVAGTGMLLVGRYREPMRLTDGGWITYQSPRQARGYEGVQTCPVE